MPESPDLDPARRRLLYRCWHRGTRELDLLLGRYADSRIGEMDEAELGALEELLEVEERELFAWLIHTAEAPRHLEAGILDDIRRYHAAHPVSGG